MKAKQVRQLYLDFFAKHNHAVIPPAPIIPPDDPTTLFTSSGMQQLVPYLKGKQHPMGKRLVNSQACFRAEDIDEVGDNRHTTFFEMLGNWSLGDYFKKQQLSWFWQLLTQELNLPEQNLHITLFQGTKTLPKDEESYNIWLDLGVDKDNIHWYKGEKNWWSRSGTPQEMPAGEIGGPDSEVFFDFGKSHKFHENSSFKDEKCHVNCDCGRYLEIGNSVFMQYEKLTDGTFKPLPNKNVDFGGGLERIVAATQNTPDIFQTDLFLPIIKRISEDTGKEYKDQYKPSIRTITDHIRGATIMLSQGVMPSNKRQGHFVRRLLRQAVVKMRNLDSKNPAQVLTHSSQEVMDMFDGIYLEKQKVEKSVIENIKKEVKKFSKVLDRGVKKIKKQDPNSIDASFAFDLYQSYGLPLEITQEILAQENIKISQESFDKEFQKHQEKSRSASEGVFKGGLADQKESTKKLHTATHLLHQSLREVLGDNVEQAGSNITSERLRFDFTYPKKLTQEQIKKIEKLINKKIQEDLPVKHEIMKKEKALKSGAIAFFREKYPEKVSIYTIGKEPEKPFSKEFCRGPHVSSTGEIGGVKIKKEESLGAGKRRIYAILKE